MSISFIVSYIQNICIIIACDRGSYGLKCRETCGHCQDVTQCSNINGPCFTGCKAGCQRDLCKTGRYLVNNCIWYTSLSEKKKLNIVSVGVLTRYQWQMCLLAWHHNFYFKF